MQNPLSEYNPEMEMFENEQFRVVRRDHGRSHRRRRTHGARGRTARGERRAGTRSVPWRRFQEGQGVRGFVGPARRSAHAQGRAKKALPIAGGVAGTFFGGPLGASIGGKLGSMASNLFEMELEGLSQEDREFEAAKQFVRFASEAVKNASSAPGGNPVAIARSAIAAGGAESRAGDC